MSSPELHTDDLLDREIRGLLTSEERVRLDEHLRVCAVCRFERAVRGDFRAEFEALNAAPPQASREASVERITPATRRRTLARALALVAVLVLVAGAATAELAGGSLLSALWTRAAVAPSPPASVSSAPRRPSPALSRALGEASAAVEPTSAPSSERAPLPTALPTTGVAPSTHSGQSMPVASAGSLFEEAREAREQGNYALAVERYEGLLKQYPSSPQALTTHAVLGRLLLDRGEPAAALPHFDAYLSSGATALGEEALLGRALAFGKLGQSMQEAEAWQALLRHSPTSLHAGRARERLHQLTGE
jgi:TolA-binding protein